MISVTDRDRTENEDLGNLREKASNSKAHCHCLAVGGMKF
jgi:hypothetical protein